MCAPVWRIFRHSSESWSGTHSYYSCQVYDDEDDDDDDDDDDDEMTMIMMAMLLKLFPNVI
jgi:hypothetical protein